MTKSEKDLVSEYLKNNNVTECPPAKAEGITYNRRQNKQIAQDRKQWSEETGLKLNLEPRDD